MARSDKVAFRREYTVTENGYLGDVNGTFVGDILSLHVDIVSTKVSIIIDGKVGRSGDWNRIGSLPGIHDVKEVDLKEYEYVRICVFNVEQATNIILFGYESPVIQKEISVLQSEEVLCRQIENNKTLIEIAEELKKINFHLSLINDEEGI